MNQPTLILLPGMIGTPDLFAPLLAMIPQVIRHRVISYPTDMFLDYPRVLQYIESQVVEETNMVIIGESYAGALALMLAVKHPARIRAVVISGAYTSPPWPRSLRFLIHPVLLKIRMPSFIIRFFAAGENASEEFVTLVRNALRVPSPKVMVARAREALCMDNTQALLSCQQPILYLAPNRDRLVPAGNVRNIIKLRPDVRIVLLDGPHLILQTAPKAAWNAIDSFVASIPE